MANTIYPEFCNASLGGIAIDLGSDEVRVLLIDTAVYAAVLTDLGDAIVSDIPPGGILGEEILVGQTWANRIFDADNLVDGFPDHGGGDTGEALVLYVVIATESNAITGVNQGTKTFTITDPGDAADHYAPGKRVDIDSGPNAGRYDIASIASPGGGDFDITVYQDIPDATVAGNIETSGGTSRLFLYLDTVTGLPVTLDGSNDSITWDDEGIWEFATSCP